MNKNHSDTPFLLIETPRAGKWNHRHIVPPGVSQQAYLNIIETARQKGEGDNFLAVGHDNKVKQFTTDRYAPELLILAGIDTKRLSKNQKQALQDSLTSLLGSVDKLVTEDIDWNREGETDPVVSEKLAVWFDQHFKDIETIVWNPNLKRLSKKIMSATITIFLVSLGLVSYFGFKGDQPPKEESDVIAANQLIEALSNVQPSVDRDAITKELEYLNLIKNQEGKMKISSDMKGTVLTSIIRKRVFPEEIEELFSSKENSVNLKDPQTVNDLTSCKKGIITLAGLKDSYYTPFITMSQVDTLKIKIKKHRTDNDGTYKTAIRADENLESRCSQNLADTSPLEFLIKCYKDWGQKNRDDPFWKNAESLLDSCGKVKL